MKLLTVIFNAGVLEYDVIVWGSQLGVTGCDRRRRGVKNDQIMRDINY
jgi:hypothetical protein